jgi:putative membrane protein
MSDEPGRDSGQQHRPPDPESRARTHLANERTLLAWLRTGLSLIALGVGAAQFLNRDLTPGIPSTTLFYGALVACGVFLIMVGSIQYDRGRRALSGVVPCHQFHDRLW